MKDKSTMPCDVIHAETARKVRRNTEYQLPSYSPTSSGSSTGSLTFLKKLWKEKKNDSKRLLFSDSEDASLSSDCSSPSLFRRVSTNSSKCSTTQQQANLLTVNTNDNSRSRSPSPSSLFRKTLGRRSSTSNEKTSENLLHYFVSRQDYSSLEKLLFDSRQTVDINMMRPPGISALHVACLLGSLKIVKLLVSKGADVRLKTMAGLSPLKVAVISGSYEIAQYLVSAGASDDDIKNGFQLDKSPCERRPRSV